MAKRSILLCSAFFCLLSPLSADVVHEVARGDNLYHIARHYWPEAYREDPYGCVKRIEDANDLDDPGSIYPGDELVIPGIDEPASATEEEKTEPATTVADEPATDDLRETAVDPAPAEDDATAADDPVTVSWVVQRGDTPGAIASTIGRRYGCTISWRSMLDENGVDDPRKLREGTTLVVTLPAAKAVAAAAPSSEEGEPLLGVELVETVATDGVEGSAAGARADLLDLGLLRERKSHTDATELRLAVKRLYSSSTYKTFRGTVSTADDGGLEVVHSSKGDLTAEILAEVERQKKLRAAAKAELGEHFDEPSGHPSFPAWLEAASRHLTQVSDPRRRLAIMQTLVTVESSGGKTLVSSAGCIGVGQLAIATADQYGVNPWNARENLVGAAKFINDLIRRYKGSLHKAMAYYNAGGNLTAGAGYARRFTAQVDRRAIA